MKPIKMDKTITILLIILFALPCLFSSTTAAIQSTQTVTLSGTISNLPQVHITVNPSTTIGNNKLSIGTQIDYEWKEWLDRSSLQQLTQNANFKIIRVFDFRKQTPRLSPCTYWNEATKTGTFSWTNIDALTQKIFAIGAEPLFCLGWATSSTQNYIPTGMSINPNTGLPYPDSWAAYCKEWVIHFKNTNMPVRFYETTNEPWAYLGWNDYTKISNYMAMFNAAANAMKTENPNVLISFDGINRKPVLNYWLANGGADIGFISLHKYDEGTIGQYSDEVMLNRAETFQFVTSSDYYGIQDAKQAYFNARGKWILAINSESNFNSACDTGTDPRIQQMVGSVWLALMMRSGILNQLDYSSYYYFASSASWERSAKTSGGVGFGMVNVDDNKPWYPYFVNKMVGSNLSPGDTIVEAYSDSASVRVLAWKHEGTTNVLLISKARTQMSIVLSELSGQRNVSWIDETIPFTEATLQSKVLGIGESFQTNGYTVALLQF